MPKTEDKDRFVRKQVTRCESIALAALSFAVKMSCSGYIPGDDSTVYMTNASITTEIINMDNPSEAVMWMGALEGAPSQEEVEIGGGLEVRDIRITGAMTWFALSSINAVGSGLAAHVRLFRLRAPKGHAPNHWKIHFLRYTQPDLNGVDYRFLCRPFSNERLQAEFAEGGELRDARHCTELSDFVSMFQYGGKLGCYAQSTQPQPTEPKSTGFWHDFGSLLRKHLR